MVYDHESEGLWSREGHPKLHLVGNPRTTRQAKLLTILYLLKVIFYYLTCASIILFCWGAIPP